MARGEIGQSIFPRYRLRAHHPEAEGRGVIGLRSVPRENRCLDINQALFVLLHLIHIYMLNGPTSLKL